MKYVEFTPDEKAKLFDEIASHFYEANFGEMSKSDIEVMMFRFYIEKLVKQSEYEDGTIDYRKCSDYKISQDLGITQQRIRNLKVKTQLRYPVEFKWELAFAKLTENARYDTKTKKIMINIPDPNLYLEIQNFFEEKGAYVEKQLNSKILQIRAEYYIDLILALEEEKSRKEIIKELKSQLKAGREADIIFDKNNIGKSLMSGVVDITTIAANLQEIISPKNVLGVSLIKLLLENGNEVIEKLKVNEVRKQKER